MKTEKNIRKGFGLTGKIAMFCIGLVSLVLTSCRIRAGNPAELSVYRGNNACSQGTRQERRGIGRTEIESEIGGMFDKLRYLHLYLKCSRMIDGAPELCSMLVICS